MQAEGAALDKMFPRCNSKWTQQESYVWCDEARVPRLKSEMGGGGERTEVCRCYPFQEAAARTDLRLHREKCAPDATRCDD